MRIQDMPGVVWGLVLVGILLGVGILVVTELSAGLGATSADNVTKTVYDNATLGVLNISKQLPTVGTIFGVLLIVGAVVMLFFYFRGKEQY